MYLKNEVLVTFFLFFSLWFVGALFYIEHFPLLVLGTFVCFLLSFIGIIKAPSFPFKIYWFFQYLALVLAPIGFYSSPDNPLVNYIVEKGYVFSGLLLPIVFNSSFLYSQLCIKVKSLYGSDLTTAGRSFPSLLLYLNLLFAVSFIPLSGGLSQILLPRFEQGGRSIYILLAIVLLLINYSNILISFKYKIKSPFQKYKIFILLISLLVLLTYSNPFNSPRFILFAAWGPLFLILFPALLLNFNWLIFASLVIIILIMPILSVSTRFGLANLDLMNIFNQILSQNFYNISGQYLDIAPMNSAFMIFRDSINDIGSQIFLNLIFFVPRSIFPAKPELASLDLGDTLYNMGLVGTRNLSFPIYNSICIDLGVVGVFIAGFIFAYLLEKLVVLFRNNTTTFVVDNYQFSVGEIIFSCLIPIICRGPVAAVMPAAFLASIYLILIQPMISYSNTITGKS